MRASWPVIPSTTRCTHAVLQGQPEHRASRSCNRIAPMELIAATAPFKLGAEMPLILIILILLLIFGGGGGLYLGGPAIGGGIGGVLLILLILFLVFGRGRL